MDRSHRQNLADDTPWGCAVLFAGVVAAVIGVNAFIPAQQRVKEKTWTYEQKESETRPAGEKIGRAVGRFGVDFGRGLREGMKEASK